VIIGGLAELCSGAISMGLSAFLSNSVDRDHYEAEKVRERAETDDTPNFEKYECFMILEKYGIDHDIIHPYIEKLAADKDQWVQVRVEHPNIPTSQHPSHANISSS
jgi:vacuolar iron transporter family protein